MERVLYFKLTNAGGKESWLPTSLFRNCWILILYISTWLEETKFGEKLSYPDMWWGLLFRISASSVWRLLCLLLCRSNLQFRTGCNTKSYANLSPDAHSWRSKTLTQVLGLGCKHLLKNIQLLPFKTRILVLLFATCSWISSISVELHKGFP